MPTFMNKKTTNRLILNGSFVLAIVFACLPPIVANAAATQVVTTTSNAGSGSLRAAIEAANISNSHTPIHFAISSGHQSICLATPLPPISVSVNIDGRTQPGYNGTPLIELDGSCSTEASSGLEFTSDDSTVNSLVINNFSGHGIFINDSNNHIIKGNYIGTDASGVLPKPNGENGIHIQSGNNNRIGGTLEDGRNLISANNGAGIVLTDGSSQTEIIHNLIGTNISGTGILGNTLDGIIITESPNNTIGGDAAVFRNIVSGNGRYGIVISGPLATGNQVIGNYIGPDITGLNAVPNVRTGILIYHAPSNTIGGYTHLHRNVISGNTRSGITVDGSDEIPEGGYVSNGDANNNRIIGNYIGVDSTGNKALPNVLRGVTLYWAQNNFVGGDATGAGNVISGNGKEGVTMLGECLETGPLECQDLGFDENRTAFNNHVRGSLIGVGADGVTAIPNGTHGVLISHGSNNRIGLSSPGSGNFIMYNTKYGVRIQGLWRGTNTIGNQNTISANVLGDISIQN